MFEVFFFIFFIWERCKRTALDEGIMRCYTRSDSFLSGKYIGKWGATKVMFTGLLFAAIGFFWLLIIAKTTPEYAWIVFPFLAIGFGVSFTTPAMTFAAISSAKEEQDGIAAAVLNTVNQVGSLIGVAIFGTIISISKTRIIGMHVVFSTAGTLFLGAAFLSLYVGIKDSEPSQKP